MSEKCLCQGVCPWCEEKEEINEKIKNNLIIEMLVDLQEYMTDRQEFECLIDRIKLAFGIEYHQDVIKYFDDMREFMEQKFPCNVHDYEECTDPDRQDNDIYFCKVCGLHFDGHKEALK